MTENAIATIIVNAALHIPMALGPGLFESVYETVLTFVLPVHKKQLFAYLRLDGKQAGLLINLNEARLNNGITRVVNGLVE